MIQFPRFIPGIGKPNRHDTRPRVVDLDGCLDAVAEFQLASKPTKFGATSKWEKLSPFRIVREAFGVCPAAFQWDELTGRAIEVANLYHNQKPPPDRYDRRTMALAQAAAAAQADYYRRKIPKSKDMPPKGKAR